MFDIDVLCCGVSVDWYDPSIRYVDVFVAMWIFRLKLSSQPANHIRPRATRTIPSGGGFWKWVGYKKADYGNDIYTLSMCVHLTGLYHSRERADISVGRKLKWRKELGKDWVPRFMTRASEACKAVSEASAS